MRRLTIEEVREEFAKRGYTFTDDHYKGVDTYHKCLCVCGREDTKCLSAVRAGKRCKECLRESRLGSNNPRYNPNLTDEERNQNRDFPGYKDWAKAIKEQDEFHCFICGTTSVKLVSHHIVPFSKEEKLRTDINNGITLCDECHKDYHKEVKLSDVSLESLLNYAEFVAGKAVEWEEYYE